MKTVPFYANTKDNLHCYQAALRMVLKYFLPKKTFPFKKLDRMTGHREGLWTWPIAGAVALAKLGFDVQDIEVFDYKKFIRTPREYLYEFYGKQIANEQEDHSDINRAAHVSRAFMKYIRPQYRIPALEDISKLLLQGYLVVCLVDAKRLNRKKGYEGHFVVIFKMTNSYLFLHDPGKPPHKNRKVTKRVFEEAWARPNNKAKNVIAFKL